MTENLFRLDGTVEDDPAIAAWMQRQAEPLRSIAERWWTEMRQSGDEVREVLHDGCPVACLGEFPFGYVNVFQAHVNVGFFLGAMLPDPAGLLLGTGKRMRHVKLRPDESIRARALSRLIEAAYADIKSRVELGIPPRF